MESALHSTNGKFELQGSLGARKEGAPRPTPSRTVDALLKIRTHGELHRLRRRDLYWLASLWVHSGARLPSGRRKRAEARKCDLVAVRYCGLHGRDERIERALRVRFAQLCCARD